MLELGRNLTPVAVKAGQQRNPPVHANFRGRGLGGLAFGVRGGIRGQHRPVFARPAPQQAARPHVGPPRRKARAAIFVAPVQHLKGAGVHARRAKRPAAAHVQPLVGLGAPEVGNVVRKRAATKHQRRRKQLCLGFRHDRHCDVKIGTYTRAPRDGSPRVTDKTKRIGGNNRNRENKHSQINDFC
ncbi:MAG: hypothetical protein CL678_00330 [Bdellovibrionaceae bacterium]|nr:hypothetical protein [Pseudobdellovibrionaceae bacterium]